MTSCMRKVKKYNEFVNESIISKAKELINFKQIKKNDEVASKYFDMIYADFEKKKDLLKVFIDDDPHFKTFKYKIDDNEDNFANMGNTSDGGINITMELIDNISNWDSDISRGRIEATIYKPYKGDLKLFGRQINTNELIIDENGTSRDTYSYINISPKKINEIIKFFKSKFIEKYPTLHNHTQFSYSTLFSIDKKLVSDLEEKRRQKQEKDKADQIIFNKKILSIIEEKSILTIDDVEDIFLEKTDQLRCELIVKRGYFCDNGFFTHTVFDERDYCEKINTEYVVDDDLKKLKKDKIYYILQFDENIGNFDGVVIKDFIDNSTRVKGYFNLIEYGRSYPIIRKAPRSGQKFSLLRKFDNFYKHNYVFILEQK